MQPRLPVRKSKEELLFYFEHGKTFGNILYSLYEGIKDKNLSNGYEVEQEYSNIILKEFGSWPKKYPFIEQKNYLGDCFGSKLCVSINNSVAHCRPNSKKFKSGDIISVDVGLALQLSLSNKYLFFDSAFTVMWGQESPSWVTAPHKALVKVKEQQAKTTHRTAEIIHSTALEHNLDTVVMLTGHGIGYSLHEEPIIRNVPGSYLDTDFFNGLCFCIEPIFVLPGKQREAQQLARAYVDSDGWSIRTISGQPSSHFETMFCISNGNLVDICGITKWFC
jgi:methionyl aminopeptidase